jgi:ABC-type multidrug transport system ATPase subunit
LRVAQPSAEQEPAPPPLVVADGLMVTGPRGGVFGPVAVRLSPGEVLAVTGPGGSGRTALLLALAGRLRVAAGRLEVGGHALGTEPAAVRDLVAVARAGHAVDLDDLWTVGDAIADRAVLLARRRTVKGALETAVRARLSAAGIDDLATSTPLHALAPPARTLLDLALAAAEDRPVVVLDDVDRGLVPADERRVWAALRALAQEGRVVLAATTDPGAAAGPATTILALEPAA